MAIRQKTFTSADLTLDGGQYKLVYTHNLNTAVYIPSVYDNNGKLLGHNTEYSFSKGNLTADNKPNICTVSFSDDIPGTYELYLEYGAAESTSGRKAFELGEADPADDYRVILGKADTPSINVTLTSLYAKLLAKLGFLKVAQNLNDLENKATARTNLGVYSTTDVDSGLATKATLYQAGSGAVLGVANTAVYNPSATYHPATKAYADNIGFQALLSKSVSTAGAITANNFRNTAVLTSDATISKEDTGLYRVTHNLGSTNYFVLATALGAAITPTSTARVEKYSTYFLISFADYEGTAKNDTAFDFFMFRLNTFTA